VPYSIQVERGVKPYYDAKWHSTKQMTVADILRELAEFGVQTFVHDPEADAAEAMHEYGVRLCSWDELPAADAVILAGYVAQNPELLRLVGKPFTTERYGIGLRKGDPTGQAAVADAFKVVRKRLGVPTEDHEQLKNWSADFAEVLGNFQHNPDRAARMLRATEGMAEYFRERIREQKRQPREGLINALLTAEIDGDRLTEEEVVANCIITMVGGQETTTNLIGNGVLTLLRHPAELARLRADLSLIPSAVEELLRFEPPSQHTARMAPDDIEMGGKRIKKRQAVIAVMAAGNRDPERFPDPDRLDLGRTDNRHLSFGWGAHFCFGAPLARLQGRVTFRTLLRRVPRLHMNPDTPLAWRDNLPYAPDQKLIRFDRLGHKHLTPCCQRAYPLFHFHIAGQGNGGRSCALRRLQLPDLFYQTVAVLFRHTYVTHQHVSTSAPTSIAKAPATRENLCAPAMKRSLSSG